MKLFKRKKEAIQETIQEAVDPSIFKSLGDLLVDISNMSEFELRKLKQSISHKCMSFELNHNGSRVYVLALRASPEYQECITLIESIEAQLEQG